MSHFLNQDQQMIRDSAARFARNELLPIANEIDQSESTPDWVVKRCAELGFFGLCIAEEYGGIDAGLVTACVVLEEIAKASPAFAGLLSVQMILCPDVVALLGTPEQKQRILPACASGERLLAYSQTEPAGIANVPEHQTRLIADGNGYRLDGHKLYCTQGAAKTYLVMARTSRDGQHGYGCVIVEAEDEGFQAHRYEDKLGWRGTNTGAIAFNDLFVAADDVLGDLLTAASDHGPANQASFIGHAATSLGCLVGLFDHTVAHVKERSLYGEPMWRLSPISDRIGQIYTKIEACRAMIYNAARQIDEGTLSAPLGCACKAFVCDTAFDCCNQLLQMWGGSGIMHSTGMNRYFRDARTNMIAEGATEIHHALIMRWLGFDERMTGMMQSSN